MTEDEIAAIQAAAAQLGRELVGRSTGHFERFAVEPRPEIPAGASGEILPAWVRRREGA